MWRLGHGASNLYSRKRGSHRRYQDTLDIIDHVAAPGGHVIVGSSIGAWIALKVAACRRERIKVWHVFAELGNNWSIVITQVPQRKSMDGISRSHTASLPVIGSQTLESF